MQPVQGSHTSIISEVSLCRVHILESYRMPSCVFSYPAMEIQESESYLERLVKDPSPPICCVYFT